MIDRVAMIEAEARTWVGVRVFHKGRTRAGGVDCLGLVMGVGLASGAISGPIDIPDYGRLPNPRTLIRAMDAHTVPIDKALAGPGDIAGISWGLHEAPMHLAVIVSRPGRLMIVHASPEHGEVKETGFAGSWYARFCRAWRFPNVAV